MSIPTSIISELNELEADHDGSVKNVSESDPTLKKLRQFFSPSESPIKKENEIKELIEDGFSRQEVVDKTSTSLDTVRRVINRYHLVIRPMFSYVAVKKGSPKIYSNNYYNYHQVISGRNCGLPKMRAALARKGYRLIRLHKPIHWKKLAPGDIYLERKGFCVKK